MTDLPCLTRDPRTATDDGPAPDRAVTITVDSHPGDHANGDLSPDSLAAVPIAPDLTATWVPDGFDDPGGDSGSEDGPAPDPRTMALRPSGIGARIPIQPG